MGQKTSKPADFEPQGPQGAFVRNIPRVVDSCAGFEDDPSRLNRILEVFTTVQVKRDREETRTAREYVTKIVENILVRVKAADSRFDFEPIRTGSDFQRVAVQSSSDFDIVLQFKNFPPVDQHGSGPIGWSTVTLNPYASTWPRSAFIGNELSSEMVRSTFARCVSEAISALGYWNVSKAMHGPAISLKIKHPFGPVYEVDLVPAIKTESWPREARRSSSVSPMNQIIQNGTHLVAKLHPNHRDRKVLWSISFFAAENTRMRQYDPGCRNQVLRILKALSGIHVRHLVTSYHLKNIWLYELEKHPNSEDWRQNKLGERFLDLMYSIRNCLRRVECPQYFIDEINLFENLDNQHLRGLGNLVGKIIQNPAKYLDLEARNVDSYAESLHCHYESSQESCVDHQDNNGWCTIA